MERIYLINPERIEWCCAQRGITTDELREKVGIGWDAFRKMMAGVDGITFNQLRDIAQFFNRGILFFLEQGPVSEEQLYSPQFRTIANQKPELSARVKAIVERAEEQREVYLSLREDLAEADQLTFSPPLLPQNDIKGAAAITRKWLGLEERNTFESYREAIEAKNILVFRSNGFAGKWQIEKESPISGFTIYHDVCPIIVVKKQDADSRQVFTLMHELGHVLLHRGSFIDDEEDFYSYHGKERESNAFAGYLLVPDEFLERIDDHTRPREPAQFDTWLSAYREHWDVSGEMILRRLLDERRLTQVDYDAYRTWRHQRIVPEQEGGSRKNRFREPKEMFGDPFVRTVLDALHARQISLAKASTYLDNLKIADVHRLEDDYAHL